MLWGKWAIMLRKFFSDTGGNYSLMLAVAIVPIMGALALAVDYAEMSRQRQLTLNALDAAGVATARRVVEGATPEELRAYAQDFFVANLRGVSPDHVTLNVVLPNQNTGGGTLKLSADLTYDPYFLPTFAALIGKDEQSVAIDFKAQNEIRLKNTLEVALVLDNSGSMDYNGSGSGKKRIVLLKDAAKQLVDTIAQQAAQMKQVDKPVQFALVPFAASVNVGPDNANAAWMDTDGISPVHHENFDWSTMSSGDKRVEESGGIYYKKGSGWGAEENQKVTRFTLYNDMKYTARSGRSGNYTYTPTQYARWAGCVESRPSPYDRDNTVPSKSKPETLFVPMFAPDEAGNVWTDQGDKNKTIKTFGASASYWDDLTTSTSTKASNQLARQRSMTKYFTVAPYGAKSAAATYDDGPNASCTTKPITPLTDVSTADGLNKIKTAIDDMQPLGGTNVPEGIAWGWRAVSGALPFDEGRPDSEKGNDKVVIVLTDGENTYYTPGSLGYNDYAGNNSIYSSYGYAAVKQSSGSYTRLFMNTSNSVSKTDYSNANYTKAMNEHMGATCTNARSAGVIVMTVALDLSSSNTAQKAQIEALKTCASDSRFRRDPTDASKPAKLFWNTTGGNLAETFREIADELSNLRIVG